MKIEEIRFVCKVKDIYNGIKEIKPSLHTKKIRLNGTEIILLPLAIR